MVTAVETSRGPLAGRTAERAASTKVKVIGGAMWSIPLAANVRLTAVAPAPRADGQRGETHVATFALPFHTAGTRGPPAPKMHTGRSAIPPAGPCTRGDAEGAEGAEGAEDAEGAEGAEGAEPAELKRDDPKHGDPYKVSGVPPLHGPASGCTADTWPTGKKP